MTTAEARADPWDRKDELLAKVVDELTVLAFDFRHKGRPKPHPRPAWVRGSSGQTGIDHAFAVMMATTRTIS